MPAVTPWPTKGTTRGHCRLTSDIATSSIWFATLSCRQRASRTFGANECFAVSVPRPTGSATQVTVRGTVVVNSGDEMASAYLVSTYDFDGKHIAISVDVVDRKISDQQGYWISIEKLVNLKELTGT